MGQKNVHLVPELKYTHNMPQVLLPPSDIGTVCDEALMCDMFRAEVHEHHAAAPFCPSQMPTTASAATSGLVVVSAIFPVLSAIALYLRVIARRRNATKVTRSDEIWLLISWLTTLPLSIVVWVVAARSGINRYKIDAVTGTKYSLAFTLTDARPISEPWSGHATLPYDTTALGLAQVGTNLGLDVVVLCFPIPVISRLHMPTQRKVVVGMIFWLGIFCCVASIVRLVLLEESLAIIDSDPDENIYLQADIIIWKIIEPNASIIAACLPCYGPFLNSRTAESIVQSVRSVISLRSLRSPRGSQSSGGRTSNKRGNDPSSDSQVELTHQDGAENGRLNTGAVSDEQGQLKQHPSVAGSSMDRPAGGITVTTGITVVSK
ncbi:hypothetical protein J7T55_007896 [Diaporthe amygdali]|uniref:uncharacterized protein n=1 Tax=Phomopsis amygdali TaxID=1214568 RepID=UPI0022FDE5BB|nr:uncharacterized protein J7T55_007896 [Diaporthe amygdali]KAJ0114062.1 hypothetical protein J7T55_007896 [Diaporthe amygdali]